MKHGNGMSFIATSATKVVCRNPSAERSAARSRSEVLNPAEYDKASGTASRYERFSRRIK